MVCWNQVRYMRGITEHWKSIFGYKITHLYRCVNRQPAMQRPPKLHIWLQPTWFNNPVHNRISKAFAAMVRSPWLHRTASFDVWGKFNTLAVTATLLLIYSARIANLVCEYSPTGRRNAGQSKNRWNKPNNHEHGTSLDWSIHCS
jgi:hypothetical protein